jgi:hypothetical protein
MADTTNAANWSSSQGNASAGPYANSCNNSIPQTEADPKDLFDDYSSTQSSPQGFYPYGMEAPNDVEVEDFVPDSEDVSNLPASEFNPRMPARGSRLIDQPPARRGFGIMSK